MRHRKQNIRFGRQRSHYKATLRHLVSGLILNKSISTTKVRAKETSRLADRLVTMGKEDSLASRRRAYDILRDRDLVSVLFNELAPLFKDRKGGYTRVMLIGRRRGDNAQMAILEFVEKPEKEETPSKKGKKKKAKPAPVQKQPKVEVEKKTEPEKPKPRKEEVVEKKEKPKKEAVPSPEKPEAPEEEPGKKPGFFKRFFGRNKEK